LKIGNTGNGSRVVEIRQRSCFGDSGPDGGFPRKLLISMVIPDRSTSFLSGKDRPSFQPVRHPQKNAECFQTAAGEVCLPPETQDRPNLEITNP